MTAKLLPAALGLCLLSACAPATILGKTSAPPAVADASGTWTGRVSHPIAGTFDVTANFSERNDPVVGQIVGDLTVSRLSSELLSVTGDLNAGTLRATGNTLDMECKGKFTNRTLFEGRCTVVNATSFGVEADLVLTRS
ncbi:hypothetical protein [Deinococcus navajonensis]|uniref:Uncharacterized protein n=1 Tax=Deinococcus navajonensis TaxID=309884 RepID=A0ABV8XNH6_9DEIO